MTFIQTPPERSFGIVRLHPNFMIGGLQLFSWLFFCPSAWRQYIARIDPDLPPDFCLAELSRAHWQNRSLQRLICKVIVLWAILVVFLSSLILSVWLHSPRVFVPAIGYGLLLGFAGSLLVGLVVGFAACAAGGVVISMVFSLAFASALQVSGGVTPLVEGFSRVGAAAGVAGGVAGVVNLGAAVGIAISIAVGVSGFLAGSPVARGANHPLLRQIGGIVIGVFISGVTYGIALGIALYLSKRAENVAVVSLVFAVMVGAAITVAGGMKMRDWRGGTKAGLLVGVLIGGIVFSVFDRAGQRPVGLFLGGMSTALFYSTLFALSFVLAERIADPRAGAVASAIGSGGGFTAFLMFQHGMAILPWYVFPLSLAATLIGLALPWWQPILSYPFEAAWNRLLYRAEQRYGDPDRTLLPRHSAFWHEYQRHPLYGLEDHLLFICRRNPELGRAAMETLAVGHQRWAVQAAQVELDAMSLEQCRDLGAIRKIHHHLAVGNLKRGAVSILSGFMRVSQDVDAALNQESNFHQRIALSAAERRLSYFLVEMTGSSEPHAARFQPIVSQWHRIVDEGVASLKQLIETLQEIDNPYIIGIPLTEEQDIFVGRTTVSAEISRLVLHRQAPPLLLYGQRRMGKTSLLNNLGRLLPSTIIPMFVDLQCPASLATDYAGFLYNVARAMVASASRQRRLSLPSLNRETLSQDPFTRFDEWLDIVEDVLEGKMALLALDEFEAMESAIVKGRFEEEEVLGTLRHLIQHRPRFKVLIAGSHTLDEVQQWAAYLINVQVAHLSYLSDGEARQLIEHPVKDFSLLFEPEAVERILHLTHCHPYLVQLLCYQIVAYKNEQDPKVRRWATVSDVEAAVPEVLSQGSIFFFDLRNQVDAEGQRMLQFLALEGKGGAVRTEHLFMKFGNFFQQTLRQLLHREIIEPVEGGYRFQVELVRRWFSRLPSPHPTLENPRLQ